MVTMLFLLIALSAPPANLDAEGAASEGVSNCVALCVKLERRCSLEKDALKATCPPPPPVPVVQRPWFVAMITTLALGLVTQIVWVSTR